MNYLAHAYLSFRDPDLLLGNMISDFVKGRKKFDYPGAVQKGIALHRAIDDFTDQHAATQLVKQVFKPHYRLYSAPLADITYDHFLANDPQLFPANDLQDFSQWVYECLEENATLLPENFRRLLPYMKSQNWLFNYRLATGIDKSFAGLVHRARYMNDAETAARLFRDNYNELGDAYQQFFPELLQFARNFAGRPGQQ